MGQSIIHVGQVWWGMVPFGEIDDAKRRPVVILGWAGLERGGDAHVLVVPSSTFDGNPAKARASDMRLKDWSVAGLGEGSFIQCARLWSLSPSVLSARGSSLGTLDHADLQAVMAEVSKMFAVTGFATID